MNYFITLILKIIPLYGLIALGYFASKHKSINKETISAILIYIIAPVVVFNSVLQMELSKELLSLPFLMYGLCTFAGVVFYFIGKIFWKDSHKNLLSFAASQGNAGYFGIPLVIILFGEDVLGIYMLLMIGEIIYGFTIGYLIVAQGAYSLSESLKKLFKVPVIYAFLLALLLNIFDIIPKQNILESSSEMSIIESSLQVLKQFNGAYTVLGMMIMGLSLAGLKKTSLDWKFTILAFISRFIFWPILAFLVIYIDKNFWHIYNESIHQLIFLISIIPIASVTVVFATEFKIHPQKVALTVFLSTIFALFFIPTLLSLMF